MVISLVASLVAPLVAPLVALLVASLAVPLAISLVAISLAVSVVVSVVDLETPEATAAWRPLHAFATHSPEKVVSRSTKVPTSPW